MLQGYCLICLICVGARQLSSAWQTLIGPLVKCPIGTRHEARRNLSGLFVLVVYQRTLHTWGSVARTKPKDEEGC